MQETIYWLALQRHFCSAPRVGLRLLKALKKPEAIFAAPPGELEFSLGPTAAEWHTKLQQTPWKELEKTWESLQKQQAVIVAYGQPGYPLLLQELPDPPLVLSACGDVQSWNGQLWIGIVGARKATPYGKRMARELGEQLAIAGIGVISGLAYGIDGAAHEGALHGGGKSWGVMGTGIEQIYPPSHRELADRLCRSGGILTEFPMGVGPMPFHFPQRNRIIAGMSLGVIVVEAAVDSGSLITARLALDYNRDVFAVPGPVGHPNTQGTHRLIRQGAVLVESAGDVLQEIQGLQAVAPKTIAGLETVPASDSASDSASEKNPLWLSLEGSPKSVEQLAQEVGWPMEKTLSELTLLESSGAVRRRGGGFFERASSRGADKSG